MSRGLACAKCHKFFRTKKSGVCIEEGMPFGRPDSEGHFGTWAPYKLWMADLCECPGCGAQVATGFGEHPIAEHYEPHYQDQRETFRPLFRVYDRGGRRP